MVFLELQWEPGVYATVTAGMAIKNSSLFSDIRTPVYLRWAPQKSTRLGRAIRMLLEVRHKTEVHFLVGTVILGFLSIFKKSQVSSPFEALNSAHLSRCQSDVRPLVQMSLTPRAFSRVSTGDSDIPSSCEMKVEPAFKALQGNAAFFRIRTSRGPFPLKHKTQGPSHIPMAEGKLLLMCLWNVGLPLQSKTGNQLSSLDHMWCMELSSSCCAEIGAPLD